MPTNEINIIITIVLLLLFTKLEKKGSQHIPIIGPAMPYDPICRDIL